MNLPHLKWIFRAIRYRYRLEPQEIRLLQRHLAAGAVAVDVGAHKGAYTWWMRRAVGETGEVYAFEPQPRLAEDLRALASGGGYRNVIVENLGLSSAAGRMMLHVPGGATSPGASLEPSAKGARSFAVDVTTLDDYFDADEASRIRLLKCDAEGHELEVFKGAGRLLAEAGPCLLFECERRHRRSGSVEEVFHFLQGLGYRGWFVGRQGCRNIDEFDPEVHQARSGAPGYVNNFLFLKPPGTPAGAGA
jgi:FkbM family methyltransferase